MSKKIALLINNDTLVMYNIKYTNISSEHAYFVMK